MTYFANTWKKFRKNGEKMETIWGQNFRLRVVCVLPSDTLFTQFRKTPESAQLTGSLLQPSPASLKGHLIRIGYRAAEVNSLNIAPEVLRCCLEAPLPSDAKRG